MPNLHKSTAANQLLRHIPLVVSLSIAGWIMLQVHTWLSPYSTSRGSSWQLLKSIQAQCAGVDSIFSPMPTGCFEYANATSAMITVLWWTSIFGGLVFLACLIGSLPFGINSLQRDVCRVMIVAGFVAFVLFGMASGIVTMEAFGFHLFMPELAPEIVNDPSFSPGGLPLQHDNLVTI